MLEVSEVAKWDKWCRKNSLNEVESPRLSLVAVLLL